MNRNFINLIMRNINILNIELLQVSVNEVYQMTNASIIILFKQLIVDI